MSLSPPIIHVVDDDPSFRTAVTRLLRAAKYEVRSYGSAAEFLDSDSSAAPGCILLDLQMPGASGLDLQQSVARMEERLPIIFLTGYGQLWGENNPNRGATFYFTLPIAKSGIGKEPPRSGTTWREIDAKTIRVDTRVIAATTGICLRQYRGGGFDPICTIG
jgi:CheY-like chemotaxis protein